MKAIIVFFEEFNNKYKNEAAFSGLSATNLSKKWAENLNIPCFYVKETENQNFTAVLEEISSFAQKNEADYVIFTYSDLPFLSVDLTKELIETHLEFKAEYTFSDGYPYGFSPEIIDSGLLKILIELSKTTQSGFGKKAFSRTAIFDLIKTDINSFDVETVIADNDYRLFRFCFDCSKKENFIACKKLFESLDGKNPESFSVNELSLLASKNPEILKTVPGFYEIQICEGINSSSIYNPYEKAFSDKNKTSCINNKTVMDFSKFSKLVDDINDFSENAVISLSGFTEPFLCENLSLYIEKVLSYSGLSVFIETDGLLVTKENCEKILDVVQKAEKRSGNWEKIYFSIKIDSFTKEMYKKIFPGNADNDFSKAVQSVSLLNSYFPHCVFPQFTRMTFNECELENFFRFWNEKTSPSGGELIIQKYNDYSGLLEKLKSADLSPLERNVCWHLRRDMFILPDGSVLKCRNCVLREISGNVFEEKIEDVWKKTDSIVKEHLSCNYSKLCGKCDEYYTFNF